MGWLSRKTVIGAGMPNGVYLGRLYDPKTQKPGPEIWLPWLDLVLIIGRNRSGKDAGILIPNALKREKNLSVSEVFVDTRLEAGTICTPYRRSLGPTLVGNAFNEHVNLPGYADLRSDRLNLLKSPAYDPDNRLYFDNVSELAAAMFPSEGDHNPFFPLSSQALWAGLTMAELQEAKREGRDPSLLNIRLAATEADQMDPVTGEPVAGLTARVRRLIDEGDPQICSLLGAFAGKQSDGIRDVIATLAAHTRWNLSKAIADDEKAPRIDLAQLGKEPTTFFFGLPHNFIKSHAAYLRAVTTAIMQPLFAPHKVPVRIWLNEFYAMGRVPAVESAIGLVAGSGIQLVIVVQSLVQLKQLYGDGWEAFFGQAGAVALVGSAGDDFTAEYLSTP